MQILTHLRRTRKIIQIKHNIIDKTFFFDLSLLPLETVKYLYLRFDAQTSEPDLAFEADNFRSFQSFFNAEENQKAHSLGYLAAILAHGLVQLKYKDALASNASLYLELDPEADFDFDESWFVNLQGKDNLVALIKPYKLEAFDTVFQPIDFWIAKESKGILTAKMLLSYFDSEVVNAYFSTVSDFSITDEEVVEDEEVLETLLRLLLLGGLLAHGYIQPQDDIEMLPVLVDGKEVATLDSCDFDHLNEFGGPTFTTLIEEFQLETLKESLHSYDMITFLRKMETRMLVSKPSRNQTEEKS